jgi:hypothetical protein
MRVAILILLFVFVKPLFAEQINSSITIVEMVDDGGKSFKKRKYKHRNYVKVNRQEKVKLTLSTPFSVKGFKRRTKGGAILMAVLTGPLGGHRLYLGTAPYVPIFYALTLGGGFGLLPLVDIIVIVFTKDLSSYENKSQIIMWGDL